jgi:hypothetical protein
MYCVDLVWTYISEEHIASETSIRTRATWRHIPEDAFFIVTAVKTSNLTQLFFGGWGHYDLDDDIATISKM